MINNIFNILKNNQKIKSDDIKNIIVKKNNVLLSNQLSDIINGIILSKASFILKDDYIKIKYRNLTFYITIKLSENGLIQRFRIIPVVPKLKRIKELENVFSNFSSDYGILSTGFYNHRYKSNDKFAVSSLIKLVVACAIYKMINDGLLDLLDIYTIRKEDLSYLSVGLSTNDIGRKITIKELISRLLLASDNTAMDILLKLINNKYLKSFMYFLTHENVNILPTKYIYEKSWGVNLNNQDQKKEKIINNSVWHYGLDYFISLKHISKCLDYLMVQEWLPWDNINDRSLIYKGGSSTGVLSSIWLKNDSFNSRFLFVINSKKSINILEEIYIYECINIFLKSNNFL